MSQEGIPDGEVCTICLEAFSSHGQHTLCCLKCGHVFGKSCILHWLTEHQRCPQCNSGAKRSEVRAIWVGKPVVINNQREHELEKQLETARESIAVLEKESKTFSTKIKAKDKALAKLKLQLQAQTLKHAAVVSDPRQSNATSTGGTGAGVHLESKRVCTRDSDATPAQVPYPGPGPLQVPQQGCWTADPRNFSHSVPGTHLISMQNIQNIPPTAHLGPHTLHNPTGVMHASADINRNSNRSINNIPGTLHNVSAPSNMRDLSCNMGNFLNTQHAFRSTQQVVLPTTHAESANMGNVSGIAHVLHGAMHDNPRNMPAVNVLDVSSSTQAVPSRQHGHNGMRDVSSIMQISQQGARSFALHASEGLLMLTGQPEGGYWSLYKVSLHVQNSPSLFMRVPADLGAVKSLCLDSMCRHVLIACQGKSLSLLSLQSAVRVASFQLPAPPHSCIYDACNPFGIYAGMQNGEVLMFDIRNPSAGACRRMSMQTCQPIHTLISMPQVDGGDMPTLLAANPAEVAAWNCLQDGGTSVFSQAGCCITSLAYDPQSQQIGFSARRSGLAAQGWHASLEWRRPGPGSPGTWHPLCEFGNFPAAAMLTGMALTSPSAPGMAPLMISAGDGAAYRPWVWDPVNGSPIARLEPHPTTVLQTISSKAATHSLIGTMSLGYLRLYNAANFR